MRAKNLREQILSTLSPEELAFHQLVLNIRDKHVAHSVNNFESHRLRVLLNPEENGRKVNNVSIGSSYLAAPDSRFFERLKTLIDKLFLWIRAEQKREEDRLARIVVERYDLNELYSREAKIPDEIDYSRVRQPRKEL